MPVRLVGTPLVYYSAPKIACTSLKRAILAHNDPSAYAAFLQERAEGLRGTQVHHIYPTARFRPWWYARRLTGERAFCVVRDPIARFVSGYRNRIVHHGDLERREARSGVLAAGLPPRPEPDVFAENLERYMALSVSTRHHFMPMHWYLGWVPAWYDRVFRIDQIDEMAVWCGAHGATLDVGREQTGGPKLRAEDLPTAVVTKLKAFYAVDYRLWSRWF